MNRICAPYTFHRGFSLLAMSMCACVCSLVRVRAYVCVCVCWFTYRMLKLQPILYFVHTDAQVALFRLFRIRKVQYKHKGMNTRCVHILHNYQRVLAVSVSVCVCVFMRPLNLNPSCKRQNSWTFDEDGKKMSMRTHTRNMIMAGRLLYACIWCFFSLSLHDYYYRIQNYSLFRSTSQHNHGQTCVQFL